MFRREFIKWLGRFTFGYVVVSMGSPLRRINTTFFDTAQAAGCAQDTCTTRDACGSDQTGHACETRDVCLEDESNNCVNDQCMSDRSAICSEDDCGIDKSNSCTTDRCATDKSYTCSSDMCINDYTGGCSQDKCSGDSSGACQTDRCSSDKSSSCQNDTCQSDKSGSCFSDTCESDGSGLCQTDNCTQDSSGMCVIDYCVTDKSGQCSQDSCTTDTSGECRNDTCTDDSSIGCVSDSCVTDTHTDCGEEVQCITDGVCFSDMCPTDGLLSYSQPEKRKESPSAAGVNTALKWLYRISMFLLFFSSIYYTPLCKAAIFNVSGGDVAGLVAAVNSANTNEEEDTINLGQGTFVLTGDEDVISPGLLTITSKITINGASSGTTAIQNTGAGDDFSIFYVSTEGDLTLYRLIIKGGKSTGLGGGIANEGILTINSCTISENYAEDVGGGIANFEGNVSISNSSISGNSSVIGGGIATLGGTMTIVNTTFYNNAAISDYYDVLGGGIVNVGGEVSIKNVTISGNSAINADEYSLAYSGGIYGTLNLINTIVALNTNTAAPDLGGWPSSSGHNLIGSLTGSFWTPVTGDMTGNPGLETFMDNGTPGNGHFPLRRASRAIDKGDNNGVPYSDQIGTQRPKFKGSDIGAIESLLSPIKAMPWIPLLITDDD